MDRQTKRKSLAADIPCRIYDESAETIKELMEATGYSYTSMKTYANVQVTSSHWEQVWKQVGNKPVPAYRRAK